MGRGSIHWHPGDTVVALAARYHAERHPDLRMRWHALWLLHRGYAREEIIDLLDIHPRTLRDWIAWYRQGGAAVAQNLDGGRQGQPCRLTKAQANALVECAADGAFHTISEVQDWVAEQWDIQYSYWGIRSLLTRLKIHLKVPRRADRRTIA